MTGWVGVVDLEESITVSSESKDSDVTGEVVPDFNLTSDSGSESKSWGNSEDLGTGSARVIYVCTGGF